MTNRLVLLTLQAINTDGEITTRTPAKFSVIPKALAVFVAGKFVKAPL